MPRKDLPFCDCRWLERAAHNPNVPIEFNAEAQFSLAAGGGLSLFSLGPALNG